MFKFILIFILILGSIYSKEQTDSTKINLMNRIQLLSSTQFLFANSAISNENYPSFVDYRTNLDEYDVSFPNNSLIFERRISSDTNSKLLNLFVGGSVGYQSVKFKYKSIERLRSIYSEDGPVLITESNNVQLLFDIWNISPKISYMIVEDKNYFINVSFLTNIFIINNRESLRYAFNESNIQYLNKDINSFSSYRKVIETEDLEFNKIGFGVDLNAEYFHKLNFSILKEKNIYFGIGLGTNLFASSILKGDNLNYSTFDIKISFLQMF